MVYNMQDICVKKILRNIKLSDLYCCDFSSTLFIFYLVSEIIFLDKLAFNQCLLIYDAIKYE